MGKFIDWLNSFSEPPKKKVVPITKEHAAKFEKYSVEEKVYPSDCAGGFRVNAFSLPLK